MAEEKKIPLKKWKKGPEPKPPHNFSLLEAIRGKKQKDIEGEPGLYKANIKRRDVKVRRFVDKELKQANKSEVFPGQLVMFNYFMPKTEPQLQYYDAMPCTIFFGIVKTKEGPRVLGFNLHYYPPKIRFQLMDRIFDIFKPFYIKNWTEPMSNEVSDFNYKMIMKQLEKANLDFGIRMYIPNLMHKIVPIPPKHWQKAVFTEGHFKKETREQILKYWKSKIDKLASQLQA